MRMREEKKKIKFNKAEKSTSSCNSHSFMVFHTFFISSAAAVNESCYFNEQCEEALQETECRDGRCICRFEKTAIVRNDRSIECVGELLLKFFTPRHISLVGHGL